MGNLIRTMEGPDSEHKNKIGKDIKSLKDFKSGSFVIDDENGLFLNGIYLPEEIVVNILSHVQPKNILQLSLVCKRWCRLTRSRDLWKVIYERYHRRKAKKLPWFVYYCLLTTKFFDTNNLKNGNGQNKFKYWHLVRNGGDGFNIETIPQGADLLPEGVPDFKGNKSCFSTSYGECMKYQVVLLNRSNLFSEILNYYRPTIYVSEWWSGRFDCGSKYTMNILLRGHCSKGGSGGDSSMQVLKEYEKTERVEQWAGKEWSKVEMFITDYPEGVSDLLFTHSGQDTQFWKGHYGSKMAGAVVKVLFNSIQPKENDEYLEDIL